MKQSLANEKMNGVMLLDLDNTVFQTEKDVVSGIRYFCKAVVKVCKKDGISLKGSQIARGIRDFYRENGHYDIFSFPEKIEPLKNVYPKGTNIKEKISDIVENASFLRNKNIKQAKKNLDRYFDVAKKTGLKVVITTEGSAQDAVRRLELCGASDNIESILAPIDNSKNANKKNNVGVSSSVTESKLWKKVEKGVPCFFKTNPEIVKTYLDKKFPDISDDRLFVVGDSGRDCVMAKKLNANFTLVRMPKDMSKIWVMNKYFPIPKVIIKSEIKHKIRQGIRKIIPVSIKKPDMKVRNIVEAVEKIAQTFKKVNTMCALGNAALKTR